MLCHGKQTHADEIFTLISRDLKSIKQWLLQNNLFVNYEKTCIVLHTLTENTIPTKTCIKMYNTSCNLTTVCFCEATTNIFVFNSNKYLGIEINNNLRSNKYYIIYI
jgi:hypothetical protein